MKTSDTGVPPGTVSKILWHFTGGPKWNGRQKRQNTKPKPLVEAFEALRGILSTKQLMLGRYREVVKVKVATRVPRDKPPSRLHPQGQRIYMKGPERIVERESAPVCCLADIPVSHLSYHAARYGKVAIGFHRDATVRARFNPVFYTLHNAPPMKALHRSIEALETIDDGELGAAAEALAAAMAPVRAANERIKSFLAFIKTFDEAEFSTIYCEREWRSVEDFCFSLADIAMIVLPKAGEERLFDRFINEVVPAIGLPRSVPVVPWEDLIEH